MKSKSKSSTTESWNRHETSAMGQLNVSEQHETVQHSRLQRQVHVTRKLTKSTRTAQTADWSDNDDDDDDDATNGH